MRKYSLTVLSVVFVTGIIVWKLSGITGNEMIFTFLSVWAIPASLSFASGLTLYKYKLNLIPVTAAAVLTVAVPLWCFGTYHLIPTAIVIFCTFLGMALSSLFMRFRDR